MTPHLAALLDELDVALAKVEALRERIAAARHEGNGSEPEPTGGDGFVTAEQAASLAGVTVEQFYRRRAFRPAIVKYGHRTMRVNERKLRRILAGA
jgi:hypothetical protein